MAPRNLLFLVPLVEMTSAAVWVKGGGGSSCETVCAARGGCLESEFPTSEEAMNKILEEMGVTCESMQEGLAQYDPSSDGTHCGWSGRGDNRCAAAAGDSGTYRFCPCAADKEL